VDPAYPERWIGKVSVYLTDGRVLHGRVDEPKGDPGNTLSRDEIATKLRQLVKFSGALAEADVDTLLDDAWRIVDAKRVGNLVAHRVASGRTNRANPTAAAA
jgi:2-methylcitrate dehydratase PrpD